jgi:hypothetical protein
MYVLRRVGIQPGYIQLTRFPVQHREHQRVTVTDRPSALRRFLEVCRKLEGSAGQIDFS